MKKKLQLRTFVLILVTVGRQIALAQSSCDSITPSFTVDLSNDANATWISSPPIVREGNCCGTLAPDKCIEFVITLSPQAIAINFGIASGAIPTGSMFYQVNCGPPIAVGTPLCLNGPGPYWLTFCKPGSNTNTYQITSIGPPKPSPDDSTGNGCSAKLHTSGLLEDASLTWSSIFPGPPGAYNNYLNCTSGCDTVLVTPDANSPPYIDYVVCGYPSTGACASTSTWCDTIRMFVSPPLTASVIPNPAAFCPGAGSITLNGTPGGGVPPYIASWTSGANGAGTVIATGNTFTATTGGNYSYLVYDQNYPKCPPTIVNVPVTVIPPPQVTFTATEECLGGTTLFTDLSTTGSGTMAAWNWTFGDGSSSSTQSPSHNYDTCGAYNVVLSITSSNGCIGTNTISVSVHPPPVATFTVPNVCFGQVTPFTNLSTVSFGNISSYSWDFGNFSSIDHHQGPNYVYASPGIFSVTLSVVSDGGCSSVFTNTVEIYPKPTPDFLTNNICIGSSANFTDLSTVMGGQSINSWKWAFGDGSPVCSIQNPTHIYLQSGTYNVSLVGNTTLGCTDTVTKPITIYPSPEVKFVVPDTSTCINVCSQFLDLSTINNGSLSTWAWDFGDGGSSLQRSPQHCYAQPGSYSVSLTVTSVNGCVDNVTLANYIDVYPTPTAAFTYSPQPVDILDPVVHFKDLSDQSAAYWSWDLGDNTTADEQFPKHTYSDTGTYCITLIIENVYRCKDTAMNCLKINPDFSFYIPNAFTPISSHGVNDVFMAKGNYTGKYEMRIFDRWGNQVFYSNDINFGWDGHVNSSEQTAQEDTYIYKVEVYDPAGDRHTYTGPVSLIK